MKKALSIMFVILMITASISFSSLAVDVHSHAVTDVGEAVELQPITALDSSIADGSYYLQEDITVDNITIKSDIDLCLNGHTITVTDAIIVYDGAEVNICNCCGQGGIKRADNNESMIIVANGGKLNLYGGKLEGGYYSVAIRGEGTFNMYGGQITGSKTGVEVSGVFNMYGGEISGISSDCQAQGVKLNSSATFNLYSGDIKNNTYTGTGEYASTAIYSLGTVNMYGGRITGNNARSGSTVYIDKEFNMYYGEISGNIAGYGAGVWLATADFNMYGGKISGNTASEWGGGVYVANSNSTNIVIDGGEISGNTAKSGAGIYCENNASTITLKSGKIINNSATETSGGIGARYGTMTQIEIAGSDIQVMGNTAESMPNIGANKELVVSAPLDTQKTRIYASCPSKIAKPDGVNITTLKGYEECFISDWKDNVVYCNSNGVLCGIYFIATLKDNVDSYVVKPEDVDETETVTYQWYEASAGEFVAMQGEDKDTLLKEKLTVGKTYRCEIYLNGIKVKSIEILYPYEINHQPTLEEPYVATNDENATYQWYNAKKVTKEITDENGGISCDSYGDPASAYDAEKGWTGNYYNSTGATFFCVQLEKGQKINLEFSEDVECAYIYDEENEIGIEIEKTGKSFEIVAQTSGYYEVGGYGMPENTTLRAYTAFSEYTAIEGETSAELSAIQTGKIYACEASFADGTKEMSEELYDAYRILNKPYFEELYVTTNDENAAYQWYEVKTEVTEITEDMVETLSEAVIYDAEKGWLGTGLEVFGDGDIYYVAFITDFKAGDTLRLEFADGNFGEAIFLNLESGAMVPYVTEENGKLIYDCEISADGAYAILTKNQAYYKLYNMNAVYEAIEGETEAAFKGQPDKAKKYACKVAYSNGTESSTDIIEFVYRILKQPSTADSTVKTNDAEAEYQWCSVAEGKVPLDNERAKPFTPDMTDGAPSYMFEGRIQYSEQDGWSPMYIKNELGYGMYYFAIKLKAGETIDFKFSSIPTRVIFGNLEDMSIIEVDFNGTSASFTAPKDVYVLLAIQADKIINVKAFVDGMKYTEIEGATSDRLNPLVDGNYACKVTFSDGSTEKSDIVALVHACDFTGSWNTDSSKHWKKCVCGEISSNASHVYDNACDTTCNICDAKRTITHAYKATVTAPTCTEAGYTTYTCACGDTYVADNVKANGHKETSLNAVPATCTKTGLTEGKKCTVCDEVTVKQTTIAKKAHTLVTVKGKAATCTATGLTDGKKCSVCDTVTVKQDTIAKKAHTIVTVKGKATTCTATGLTDGKKCSVCDTVTVKQETIAKKAHTIVTVKGKAATCTATGLTDGKKCSVCDTVTVKQETIAKKAHTIVTVKGKAATCTATGLTEGKKCSVCGTVTVKQTTIAKKAHTYKNVTTKATLTKNGKVESKCSVCGKVSKTTTVYYPKTIKLSKTAYTYNGKEQKPSVTVKDSKGNTLKNGTDYTVKYESGRKNPGTYNVKITFKGKYEGTKTLKYTIAPKATGKITAVQSTKAIKLTWSKVTGATGYRVFQYNSKTKKWESIKTLKGTSFKVEKLKAGTTYKFRVKAYKKDGSSIWGEATAITTATKPATSKITKLTAAKTKATLVWSDVAGENGYEVYASTKKVGGFKKVATTKANATKVTVSKLTSGKTYYFKVRSYKTVDGAKIYSDWSAVKSIKFK